MNRFLKIGHYEFVRSPIDEMLDTQTGIVYICSPGYDACADNITPMLYDNGRPKHLNSDEIEKIKSMIRAIGETRYNAVCERNYIDYEVYDKIGEWSIQDLYKKFSKK